MPVVQRRKNIQFQLAKVYEKVPFAYPMYVEPKFDGLRGALILDRKHGRALTRTGMEVPNAAHILKELADSSIYGYVLDGEFLATNWNDTQSIVKTQTPHPLADTLNFHVFDVLTIGEWQQEVSTYDLKTRKEALCTILRLANAPHVRYVRHGVVKDTTAAERQAAKMVEAGYEGAMIKDPTKPYVFKKTADWLKLKPFFEGDFIVVGAVEGRGKHAGVLGALQIYGDITCKGKEYQVRCEVGTGFDDATRKRLWEQNKVGHLQGAFVEVEFQEITEDGKLRFPSFRRVRDDK